MTPSAINSSLTTSWIFLATVYPVTSSNIRSKGKANLPPAWYPQNWSSCTGTSWACPPPPWSCSPTSCSPGWRAVWTWELFIMMREISHKGMREWRWPGRCRSGEWSWVRARVTLCTAVEWEVIRNGMKVPLDKHVSSVDHIGACHLGPGLSLSRYFKSREVMSQVFNPVASWAALQVEYFLIPAW